MKSPTLLIVGFSLVALLLANFSTTAEIKSELTNIKLGGTEISYACLQQLLLNEEKAKTSIKLDDCQQTRIYKNGWACANISCSPEEDYAGYFEVKNSGESDNNYLVEMNWSGGGSGHFSSITGVTLDKSHVPYTLKTFWDGTGGDRAFGGIVHASLTEGKVYYSIHTTPVAFLTQLLSLVNLEIEKVKILFDHSIDGAQSYYTKSNFIYDTKTGATSFDGFGELGFENNVICPNCKPENIWLTQYDANTPEKKCLQNLLAEAESKHKKSGFSLDEATALGQALKVKCLSKSLK